MVGGWVVHLFSGRDGRTLRVEIFIQGVWHDGRVWVSHVPRNPESIAAQTFSEIGRERSSALIIAKLTNASVVTTGVS